MHIVGGHYHTFGIRVRIKAKICIFYARRLVGMQKIVIKYSITMFQCVPHGSRTPFWKYVAAALSIHAGTIASNIGFIIILGPMNPHLPLLHGKAICLIISSSIGSISGSASSSPLAELNTLRPRQNGPHLAYDIFKYIFWNEISWLKFHWSLFLRVQLTICQHWFR